MNLKNEIEILKKEKKKFLTEFSNKIAFFEQ